MLEKQEELDVLKLDIKSSIQSKFHGREGYGIRDIILCGC